jgi:hypothetical protein
MSYESCLLEVQKVAGRDLTPTEKAGVNKTISNLIKRLESKGEIDGLDQKVMQLVDELVLEKKEKAIIEKRNAIKNVQKRIKLEHNLLNNWKDDPAEGIKAFIDNSLTNREGSKRGLSRSVAAAKHNYTQGLMSRLAKKQLLDIASSTDQGVQKQIWKAMYELHQPKPDMEALGKLLPEAVDVAREFNAMNDFARVQANKAGAWIKKLPGYVMKRSHDSLKISKAAGPNVKLGDPAHQKAWKAWVTDNLDWDRSLVDVAPEDRDEVLSTMFTQLSNGYHVKFSDKAGGPQGIGSPASGLSHERVLHFKNADAEFEYHQRYGTGNNLLDNMVSGLHKMARDTAIMNTAGPNAKGNMDNVVDTVMKKLTKEGKGAEADALKKRYDTLMKTVWPNITGEASIPGHQLAARISQTSRNVMMLADLTNAIFASFTDPLAMGSVWRYTGERKGTEFFQGMVGIVKEITSNIGRSKNEVDTHLASEFGIGIETIGSSLGLLDPDMDTPGRTAAAVSALFKINGMSWWQDTIRLGSAKMTGARHAQYADRAFGDLPEGMQSLFKQFSISEGDWEAIRKLSPFEDPRTGDKIMTPEGVLDIPDHDIAHLIEGKISRSKLDNYKAELQEKYRSLFSEVAAWATTEPGPGIRGVLLRGTRPGTPEGEMLRHFMMYKTFTASLMRNHLGRELHGYRPERMSSVGALAQMFKDPKGGSLGGMMNLMFWGPMLGYVSMSAKEMAKGKEPRVPTDAESFKKIYMASAARSGALGLYGDFLFGEVTQKYGTDWVIGLAGPTARRAADVGNLYGTFRKGGDTGAEAFRLLLNNTPGYNLFYTKWMLDYGLVYRAQEAMNPGYLRRMERRVKKDKDQEYLIPPSSVIPRGGGF